MSLHTDLDITYMLPASQRGSGCPDTSQPAVSADLDDRQRAQLQHTPTNYTPTTAYTLHHSYPSQTQSHCYPYPLPLCTSTVNYVLPTYDFGKDPYLPSAHTIVSSHNYVGYFVDGPLFSPLEGQHSLVSRPASQSPRDDCLCHYDSEHYARPPASSVLPSSSSSELSHALMETPLPVSLFVKHEPKSNAVKIEYPLITSLSSSPSTSPPPTKRPPTLTIPALFAYSPSAPIHTLLSSLSSSDIGTPTSSIHLVDTGAGSSSQAPGPASSLAPNPKAGQGVLKLPSTNRRARRKPAIACMFCRERKIACGAPPVGSTDPTCNQCARRSRKCEYPTMSRRGLYKRRDNGGSHPKVSEDANYIPDP